MDPQLEKLKVFLNNFVQKVMNMQTEFNNNFNIINNQFDKIVNKIKQQEQQIILNNHNIKSLLTIINDEILYYKDRREQPPNLDMYAGGYKTIKPRKTRRTNNKRRKPKKTRKTRI